MRTLYIKDMYGITHEIDMTFVYDLVSAMEDSRILDDVIGAMPADRVRRMMEKRGTHA